MIRKIAIMIYVLVSSTSAYAQSPIQIGRSSNALEFRFLDKAIQPQHNMVYANDSLGLVTFLHRHDVTIWGGGGIENGKFRYDVSTDGGNTFTTDRGTVQTAYTNYGNTPQAIVYNPGTTSNPFDAKLLWTGSTDRFPTPGIIGFVAGLSNITTTTVTSTEHYLFDTKPTHVQGGLCSGLAGEFWLGEQMFDGSNFLDTVVLYKGIYNSLSSDVDWTIFKKIGLAYNQSYDGSNYTSIPNLAFSPNGMIGYLVFAGDLVGGADSVYNPVVIKTIDGGATWGTPTEIDLSQFTNIKDSLILSAAKAGMDPEFDVTVDLNGDLHLFTHVYASFHYGRDTASGIPWHAMMDITTNNGGTSWMAQQVGTAYTFSGDFGTPDPSTGALLKLYLQPQVSRSEDGNYVFYSWVDSDTTDIGYGELENLAPNLRVAGLKVSNGFRPPVKYITDGDLLWGGKALVPTMAPTVLTSATEFKLPIVLMEMITNDQNQPCQYWYFGNDAVFTLADFNITATKNSFVASSDVKIFPNPTKSDFVSISGLREAVNFHFFDVLGQKVSTKFSSTNAPIQELYIGDLSEGLYFIQIEKNGQSLGTLSFRKL